MCDDTKMKKARTKSNGIGNMTSHCTVVNGEYNVARMHANIWLTASIADISMMNAVDLEAKNGRAF